MSDLQTFVYRFAPKSVGIVCFLCAATAGAQLHRFEALGSDGVTGYSFAVPLGWTQKTDLPRPMIAFIAPEEQGYSANFSMNLFAKKVKPTEQKAFLLNIVSEYKKQKMEISPQTRTTLAGAAAWRWSAKIAAPNFPKVENRQVVAFRNNTAYILTFTYLPELRAKYVPLWDGILSSFRFGKPLAKQTGGQRERGTGRDKP